LIYRSEMLAAKRVNPHIRPRGLPGDALTEVTIE
jgi:hypothetical protein